MISWRNRTSEKIRVGETAVGEMGVGEMGQRRNRSRQNGSDSRPISEQMVEVLLSIR